MQATPRISNNAWNSTCFAKTGMRSQGPCFEFKNARKKGSLIRIPVDFCTFGICRDTGALFQRGIPKGPGVLLKSIGNGNTAKKARLVVGELH